MSTLEEEYKKMKKENLDLQAEKELLNQKLDNSQKEVSRLKKKTPIQSEPIATAETKEDQKSRPTPPVSLETKAPHDAHGGGLTWKPKFCDSPLCDDSSARNLDFQDEVECLDCGLRLGPEKNILTEERERTMSEEQKKHMIGRCPNCGGHRSGMLR